MAETLSGGQGRQGSLQAAAASRTFPSLLSGLQAPSIPPRLCPPETSKIVRVLCLCVSRTSNFWEHFPPCSLILLKMGGDKFPFMFHLENQTAWVRIPITSCVTLGKLLNLSVPPEP